MVRNLRFHIDQRIKNFEGKESSISRNKYRALIDNSPLAIILMDLKGNILDINDKIWDWLGYRPEDVVGKNYSKLPFLPFRSKLKIITNLANRRKGKKIPPYELEFTSIDGRTITGLVSVSMFKEGSKSCILINISNITQLKETRNELILHKHQFNTIFSVLPDMMAMLDKELTYQEVNESFANFFNLDCDEISGKTDFDLFSTSVALRNQERASLAFENKITQHTCEEITDKNGKQRYFQIIRSVFNDSNSEVIGLLFSLRDVTQETLANRELDEYKNHLEKLVNDRTKQLEKQNKALKVAMQKAEESENLKSAFLSNISHEIRTPMNAILGFSEMLRDEKNKDTVNRYIDIINDKSHALLEILNNIIDLSKLQSSNLESKEEDVNISLLVEDLFLSFKESCNDIEDSTVELILQKGCNQEIIAKTDPVRLRQILNALLDNAYKFTTEGTITFEYSVTKEKSKPTLKFNIKDTGIGVPEDKQEFIFDQFRQADDSNTKQYGGSGLGLAIAKSLTDLLGGNITFSSREGKGSEFTVYIPYKVATDAELEPYTDLIYKNLDWSDKTILITEDNPTSFLLLKSILRKTGAKILHADNGKDSVRYCQENKGIDVVLMDIQLPKMNGFDATRAIKQLYPDLPVIAQTAYTLHGEREKCMQAGCDEYLSKPINSDQLFRVLQTFI